MVNKIVRIGDQIVSLGGSIVDVPNPELEVRSTMDEEVDALLKEDVSIGDIVFEESTSVIPERLHTDARGTPMAETFMFKGKPHCVTLSEYLYYGASFCLWRYENDEWTIVNQDWPLGYGSFGVSRNDPSMLSVVVDGDHFYLFVSVRAQWSGSRIQVYRWTGSTFHPIQTPFIKESESDDGRNSNGTTQQESYGVKAFKESSGRVLVGLGLDVGVQTTTSNDGNRLIIYEFNTSTEGLTELSIEPSATLGGRGYNIDFIEYDGSTLATVCGPNPTNPPGDTNHIWQTLVWNTATSRWDFWKGSPAYAQHTRNLNMLIDSSGTLWVNTVTTGGTVWDITTFSKGTSDADFSTARRFRADMNTVLPKTITSFEVSGNLYHVACGDDTYANSEKGNYIYLVKHTGAAEMDTLQVMDSTDLGLMYLRFPGTGTRYGFFSVSHIEHNGEIHIAATRTGAGPGATQFLKFNPVTERLEQNSPKITLDTFIHHWPRKIRTVDYAGSSFVIATTDNSLQIYTKQDTGYFSGTYQLVNLVEDLRYGSYYGGCTDLLDGSGGSFRVAVGTSIAANNMCMYELTLSSGALEKLPGDADLRTNASMYNLAHAELSGNHYLWGTHWTNSNLLYFAQVSGTSAIALPAPDEATGMPHRSMNNTYCYVGAADAISFDGKIFGGYVQWQNYGGGSSINNFSWDGQDWTYIPTTSGTSITGIVSNYEGRGRCMHYHVHDNNLYLAVGQENIPYTRLYKYDSSSNEFQFQDLPQALAIGDRQFVFPELFTHDNKLCMVISDHTTFGIGKLGIQQDDGTWEIYGISHLANPGQQFAAISPVILNDELHFIQGSYLAMTGSKVCKFDPTFKYGGWRKYRGGPLSFATDITLGSIGVALEAGTKGSTIKVRRKV